MKSFLKTLNYSSSNEDSHSEVKALRIRGQDSVLCITGSGARTLDLLIEKPSFIVSIDFNPCQNFLLELKMSAIEHLSYGEYLEFLGISVSRSRIKIYRALRKSLSADSRNFWDRQTQMVERGVIYQGGWEKYFRLLAGVIGFIRPHSILKIFDCRDIDEQALLWRKIWNDKDWRIFLRCVSSRFAWKYLFHDPGFYQYVPHHFSIHSYLKERLNYGFENLSAQGSPFAALLFTGKFKGKGGLPPYLQEKNYLTLKDNLSRVQMVTQSLAEYLEICNENQLDKYSLSDFSSYTDEKDYKRIWEGIVRSASNGARVCERQFLVKREVPKDIQPWLKRDYGLEKELMNTDNSLFYTFIVGEIKRGNNA
jgi:S-adenosylmethionine-diacylglycerol 3-amino-3-carboxypropyl transferase